MSDPHNAFVERAEIAGAPDGPLAGTRFAVKDNIAVAGRLFTAGHPLYANRRATETAPAVAALLAAGATFVGMTQTDAGGFGASTPQTRNPVAPDLIVGGSSGGSAAAVAAGDCDFALGTDTGGSLRIPAACTGLFAFKPTFGRVPADGVWPLAPELDHVGPIAGDLATLRRASLVLLGDAAGETAPPERLRIAVERDADELFDPAVQAGLDAVAAALGRAGHAVERAEIPDRAAIARAHGVIVLSDGAAIYGHLAPEEREKLGRAAAAALRHAGTLTQADIEAARAKARTATGRMTAATGGIDVLISPTLPVPPPRADARRVTLAGIEVPVVVAMTYLTCLANLTGQPAVAIPDPLSRAAPPAGLQLLGRRDTDAALLGAAARIRNDLCAAAGLCDRSDSR